MITLARNLLIFFLCAGLCPLYAQQTERNVVRIVTWQPKQGMSRDFEEGYKRHLHWHRANQDPWTWHGWTISSGDRAGWFVDAAFDHTWSDLDESISPAADSADNAANVYPYGDVRQVCTYELVQAATHLSNDQLSSPLLTFTRFAVRPGAAEQFESAISAALRSQSHLPHALLRPADGTTEYLLVMAADKASGLRRTAETLRQLLAAVSSTNSGDGLIQHIRTETARYRPDLSYIPEK